MRCTNGMSRFESRVIQGLAGIGLLMLGGLAAIAPSQAVASGFDGITIIELNDPLAAKALGAIGSSAYLVTFVSGVGTYAAVMSQQKRSCVAWQREGSYTGDSIAFGIAFDEAAPRRRSPRPCYPFELTLEEGGEVRLVAENYVPKSALPNAEAPLVRYNRRRKVLMRVPLRAIDWSLPIFSRHRIREASLGPVLDDGPVDYLLSPLRTSSRGTHKIVSAQLGTRAGSGAPETLKGYAMAAEHTGWPWDAIYAMWFAAYLKPPSTIAAFDEAITQRYGAPTLVDESRKWYWLYDLKGESIQVNTGQRAPCLATMDMWNGNSIGSQNSDIGPWPCQLVMTLKPGGARSISVYQIEVVNGYAMAINHFLARIAEIALFKERLREVQGAKPIL